MSNATQYKINHKQLIEMILRSNNIREGRWMLSIDFGMAPGNFGPNEQEISPGIMVAVQNVGIQKEMPGTPFPEALVVDASTLKY